MPSTVDRAAGSRAVQSPAQLARARAQRRAQCLGLVRAHCRARHPNDPRGESLCVNFGRGLCVRAPVSTYQHLLRQRAAMSGVVDVNINPGAPSKGRDPMPYLWGAIAGAVLVSLIKR